MAQPDRFPWYDAYWLNYYCAVRQLLAQQFPARLREFEHAFDGLRTSTGFTTLKLKNFIDAQTLSVCRQEMERLASIDLSKHEVLSFGRLIAHDLPFFDELHQQLTDRVAELANEELEPSYNFLCLYNNLGVCGLHLDSPHTKWTLDVCIEQSHEWPIFISQVVDWPDALNDPTWTWPASVTRNNAIRFDSFTHEPGDALFFSGSSQWHYRERIPNKSRQNFCHLIFFHFYPKGMRALAWPQNWADHFGIPEIDGVVGECGSRIVNSFKEFKQTLRLSGDRHE